MAIGIRGKVEHCTEASSVVRLTCTGWVTHHINILMVSGDCAEIEHFTEASSTAHLP
jgi:hypothetical protein